MNLHVVAMALNEDWGSPLLTSKPLEVCLTNWDANNLPKSIVDFATVHDEHETDKFGPS